MSSSSVPSGPQTKTCPLCGKGNDCMLNGGEGSCWCFTAKIPAEVLNRIPPEARNKSCICKACAGSTAGSDAG